MYWKDTVQMVYNVTNLGRREAEIFVLNENGNSTAEIQHILETETNSELNQSTIRSIKSKLTRKHVQANLANTMFQDSTDAITYPFKSEKDFTQSLTVHAYAGKIGSGTTVAQRKQATELRDDPTVDTVQFIDPLQSVNLDGIDVYNGLDITELDDNLLETALHIIEDYKANQNNVLFVDQTHALLSQPEKINKIIDAAENSPANVSLRLASQQLNDFNCVKDKIDIVSLFRQEPPENTFISDIPLPVSPTTLSTGTDRAWSEVIRIELNNSTAELHAIYLTEKERENLLK